MFQNLAVSPTETINVIERALVGLMCLTETLSVEKVDLGGLYPQSRVHGHTAALDSLWQELKDLLPESYHRH